MANIESLPPDALRLLALNMKPEKLINFCLLKKRFNEQVCKDKIFLRRYGLLHLTSDINYLPKNIIQELMKLNSYLENIKRKQTRRWRDYRVVGDKIKYLFKHHYDKFILNNWDILEDKLSTHMDEAVAFNMYDVAKKIADFGSRGTSGHLGYGLGVIIETGDIELLESLTKPKPAEEGEENDEEVDVGGLKAQLLEEPGLSLMFAARSNNINMMKYILDILGDRLMDTDYSDAIQTAAARGDKKMLQYLLKYKTNFEKIIPYKYYAASNIIPEKGFRELEDNEKQSLLKYAAKWGSADIIRDLDKYSEITDLRFLPDLIQSGFNDEAKYYMEEYKDLLDSEIVLKIMSIYSSDDELLKYYFDNYLIGQKYERVNAHYFASLLASIKNLDVIKYMYKMEPEFFTIDAIRSALRSIYRSDPKKSKFFIDLGVDIFSPNMHVYISELPHEVLRYAVEKSDKEIGKKRTDEILKKRTSNQVNYIYNPKNLEYLYRRGIWTKQDLETEIKNIKEQLGATVRQEIYRSPYDREDESLSDEDSDEEGSKIPKEELRERGDIEVFKQYKYNDSPYYRRLKARAELLNKLLSIRR